MADIALRCKSINSEASRVRGHKEEGQTENPLLIIHAMVSSGFLFFPGLKCPVLFILALLIIGPLYPVKSEWQPEFHRILWGENTDTTNAESVVGNRGLNMRLNLSVFRKICHF
ncbi:MAG TPA: hypothetical protein PKB02_06125 [Anaerohalosphaeraceae bacterium]|nr:hypothetical protein [Anaerohalosphaeraceae bacterium]